MKKYVPEIVERAMAFAVMAHGDQLYGAKPYYYHLRAVVSTMQAFSIWEKDLLAAGYLHDVLEDTPVTKELVIHRFGNNIAAMVDACTDGEGKTRKERKVRPYRLIPQTPGAVTVKIADRLANVIANLVEGNTKLSQMYAKEQAQFSKLYECIPAHDTSTHAMAITLTQQLKGVE